MKEESKERIHPSFLLLFVLFPKENKLAPQRKDFLVAFINIPFELAMF